METKMSMSEYKKSMIFGNPPVEFTTEVDKKTFIIESIGDKQLEQMLHLTEKSGKLDDPIIRTENFLPLVQAFLYNMSGGELEVFIPTQVFFALLTVHRMKKLQKFQELLKELFTKHPNKYTYLRNPTIGYDEKKDKFFKPIKYTNNEFILNLDEPVKSDNLSTCFKINNDKTIESLMEKELSEFTDDLFDPRGMDYVYEVYAIKNAAKRKEALEIFKAAPKKSERLINEKFKTKPVILNFFNKYKNSSDEKSYNAKIIAIRFFYMELDKLNESEMWKLSEFIEEGDDSEDDDTMDPQDLQYLYEKMKLASVEQESSKTKSKTDAKQSNPQNEVKQTINKTKVEEPKLQTEVKQLNPKTDSLEYKFPNKNKIHPIINPNEATVIDNELRYSSQFDKEFKTVNEFFYIYFSKLPWKLEDLPIIRKGLGKTRFDFFINEFAKFQINYLGKQQNQPVSEDVYLTSPERCMIYYIHRKEKLHKRFLKLKKMEEELKILNSQHEKLTPIMNITSNKVITKPEEKKENKTILCRHFIKGYCKFNDKCRFVHKKK